MPELARLGEAVKARHGAALAIRLPKATFRASIGVCKKRLR